MQPLPNIALVPVEADVDVTTVDSLRTTLNRLIGTGCRRIILNMAGASYVDSAGMAMLLAEIRHMREAGGLLSLTNVSDQVLRLLKRARLVDFVPVSSASGNDTSAEPDPAALPLWQCAIPINADDLAATRASIERLLEQVPLSRDELFDAVLATGEAMGNAVDHTEGAAGLVSVIGYPDRAVIEVSDHGPGFDPAEVSAPADPNAERGRGIQLMQLLADSVSIRPRESGEGTLVRIVKLAHATTD